MMQTETSKLTFDDRKELEFQIECLERRIEEFIAEGVPVGVWERDAYELRRLRRLRK